MRFILIIMGIFNFGFPEISGGVVLLSDYEYDTAVLVDTDNAIVNQWEIPNLIKSYLSSDARKYIPITFGKAIAKIIASEKCITLSNSEAAPTIIKIQKIIL